MEPLLKVEEVTSLLGVERSTIYDWVHQRKIPHLKLANGRLRFRRSTLEKWLEKSSVPVARLHD